MKIGVRKPSLKRSIKARTTGRAKRAVKRAVIPGYGKKGSGWVKVPKRAAYNAVYHRTTVGVSDLGKTRHRKKNRIQAKNAEEYQVMETRDTLYRDNSIIIACIFGGWFGLHKYMRGQIGMGILYTLTAGLFCIGWIVDIITEVTRKPKPVYQNQQERHVSADRTNDIVKMSLDRRMEVLNDCARIIKTTDNPDVFFSRYALYSDTLKELADAELAGIKFEGESPLNKQITVLNDKEKTKATNEMITRYFNRIRDKIDTLKTDSAKENNALKFRQNLQQYEEFMTEDSIEFYRNVASKLEDDSYRINASVAGLNGDYSRIYEEPEYKKQL